MAITQTDEQKKSVAQINEKTTDGHSYTNLGAIWIIVGTGAVGTTCADAPAGSLYIRQDDATSSNASDVVIKVAKAGTGTWESLRGD